jgi:hypothetical protein
MKTCITTYLPLSFGTELPNSYAFLRHLFADDGAVNIAKFWFRPCIWNYVWSQLSSSGKSWFQVRFDFIAWGSSEDYCMYETSYFVLFSLLPFTEDMLFCLSGECSCIYFLIIKLLSLLFMCVSVYVLCWLPHIHGAPKQLQSHTSLKNPALCFVLSRDTEWWMKLWVWNYRMDFMLYRLW